jgi:tetratricopeptide (TPR) repeat protein
VASALSSSAKVYLAQKKFKQADAAYKEAIAIREKLVKEHPEVADYRARLGRDKSALGLLCRDWGRADEADKLINEAAELCRGLIDKYPNVPEYQRDLATACENMATIYADKAGVAADVEKPYKLALSFRENQVRWHPEVTEYQSDAARSHFRLACYYWKVGRWKDAVASFSAARKYYERLKDEHGEVPDYRDTLGSTLNNLALIHSLLNQHDEVPALMKGAIDIRRKLTEEYPDNFLYRANLGSSQRNFGDWLVGRNRVEESEGPYRAASETYAALVERFPEDLEYAAHLGALYNRMGLVALELDRLKDAQEWCLKAQNFWQARPASLRDLPQGKTILRDAHWGCAEALSRLGQHARAAAEWERAYALDPDQTHWLLRVPHALSLARAGDHARAAAEAKELLPLRKGISYELYRLAAAWALCSKSAAADPALDEPKRQQLAEEYASAALDALQQSREAGFFSDKRRVEQFQKDAAFEGLREKEEFRKVLSELSELGG